MPETEDDDVAEDVAFDETKSATITTEYLPPINPVYNLRPKTIEEQKEVKIEPILDSINSAGVVKIKFSPPEVLVPEKWKDIFDPF